MEFKNKLIQNLNNEPLLIRDANKKVIAYLSLVTEDDLNDNEFIIKTTEWREKFANCFLSVFVPTPDRTKKWMERSLIPSMDRVLFKIFTSDHRLVGHIGAINHDNYVELDYIIRGEKVDIKDFSLIVEKRFLKWVCIISGIDLIRAIVRSDNPVMIDFVKRTGFRLKARFPLQRKYISQDEYILEIDKNLVDPEVYLIEVEMSAEEIQI